MVLYRSYASFASFLAECASVKNQMLAPSDSAP